VAMLLISLACVALRPAVAGGWSWHVSGSRLGTATRTGARVSTTRWEVLCLNSSGLRTVPRFEPVRCADVGNGGGFSGGVNLRDLTWDGWGASTATADGTECGFHGSCEDLAAHVRAYRRRTGCRYRGRRLHVYTRLRATTEEGSTTVHLGTCPGRV
jgi:hypothetical protein